MSVLDLFRPKNVIDHSDFEFGPDLFSPVSQSGVSVDEDTAMRLIVVRACVTLIADAVRSLPVDAFRKTANHRVPVARPPGWLAEPNLNQTWGQFIDYTMHSLLTNGNAFLVITGRDLLGFPSSLEVAHPDDVEVDRADGRKRIRVSGEPLSEFTARNPNGEVLHILAHTSDGLVGLSPIEDARQAIGS